MKDKFQEIKDAIMAAGNELDGKHAFKSGSNTLKRLSEAYVLLEEIEDQFQAFKDEIDDHIYDYET